MASPSTIPHLEFLHFFDLEVAQAEETTCSANHPPSVLTIGLEFNFSNPGLSSFSSTDIGSSVNP